MSSGLNPSLRIESTIIAGRGHAGIHENVAFRDCDEESPEALGANKINRTGDLDRLGRLLPLERLPCKLKEEPVVLLLFARSPSVMPFGNS